MNEHGNEIRITMKMRISVRNEITIKSDIKSNEIKTDMVMDMKQK